MFTTGTPRRPLPDSSQEPRTRFQEFVFRLPVIPIAFFTIVVVLLFPFVPLLILLYGIGKLFGL